LARHGFDCAIFLFDATHAIRRRTGVRPLRKSFDCIYGGDYLHLRMPVPLAGAFSNRSIRSGDARVNAIGTSWCATLPMIVAMACAFASAPWARELTADPGAWRPLVHADLETELPDNLTYIDVWKDALVTNNKAYEAKGAVLVGGRNAPASDAHIVVRGATRTSSHHARYRRRLQAGGILLSL
jgi:hypothetical protein